MALAFLCLALWAEQALGRECSTSHHASEQPGRDQHCTRRASAALAPGQRPRELADPVFSDPWVQANVAVRFDADECIDGVGSQLHRLLGAYSIAACAGLAFVHSDLRAFAHQDKHDAANLRRWNQLARQLPEVQPPSAMPANAKQVHLGRSCNVSWPTLLAETRAALTAQRPTVFAVSFTYGFALDFPYLAECVPGLREQPWKCGPQPLRGIRIAAHIRRANAMRAGRKRTLGDAYYFAVLTRIAKVLDGLQRSYTIEVHTDVPSLPNTTAGRWEQVSPEVYTAHLRSHLPHVALAPGGDPLWAFQQLATADVLVQGLSTFSLSAGLVNTRAVQVAAPRNYWPWLSASHWHRPANATGRFETPAGERLDEQLRERYAQLC